MDHEERLEKYAIQVAFRAAGLEATFIAHASEDNALLTPRMRRRLRHKKHCHKTHSHLDLVDVDVQGNVLRLPCRRCFPQPDFRPVGGWRQ